MTNPKSDLFEKCVHEVKQIDFCPRLDDHKARIVVDRVLQTIGTHRAENGATIRQPK